MSHALFKYPNVVGYGRGKKGDEETVTVLVSRKLPLAALSSDEVIPSNVYADMPVTKTSVLEVGFIQAPRPVSLQSIDAETINRKDRHRPAPGGVSIGHYKITAGTLGCLVNDMATGERSILSNNHVLANSNDAQEGDVILQPGPADGGRLDTEDEIATLLRFQPIQFGSSAPTCPIAGNVAKVLNTAAQRIGSSHRLEAVKVNPQAVNRVDAAVAKPFNRFDVQHNIIDVGIVNQITEVGLGDEVTKSGRTTETTTDKILVLDATVQVSYGPAGTATFEGQIIAGPMSAGGDSGSLGVVMGEGEGDEAKAFGLLFAGSDQITIYNPIAEVLEALQITF